MTSEIRLDALETSTPTGTTDLSLEYGDEGRKILLTRGPFRATTGATLRYSSSSFAFLRSRDSQRYYIEYSDGTWFSINQAKWQVVTGWQSDGTADDMATYLLGPVFGFVMRLKGLACLHASCVAIGGHAVAFVGNAGAGKSTLAAAFALGGVPVLSDDIVAIDEGDDGSFLVRPGYPRLRLWPESVTALLGDADLLPRISPSWNKRHLDLTTEGRRFQSQTLPLGAAYILSDRDEGRDTSGFERLSPSEALIALTANGYVSYLLDRAQLAREFDLLSRLAGRVPVWRARAPAGMKGLPGFCKRIIEHVEGQGQFVPPG